jgi:hypothetical protein
MPGRMPAYFFGHGNPMNALEQNSYTQGWSKIGRETVRPKAILCVSAHWYVPGSAVTISIASYDSRLWWIPAAVIRGELSGSRRSRVGAASKTIAGADRR